MIFKFYFKSLLYLIIFIFLFFVTNEKIVNNTYIDFIFLKYYLVNFPFKKIK